MLKMKKEDSLKNYLGENRIKDLEKLHEVVEKSNNDIDDKAYMDMINILIKYSCDELNYFYAYFIIKDILNRYYDLSYNIISKINIQKNEELYKMFEFINKYTKYNIEFKLSIIDEFSKIGIIEERSLFEPITHNLYKKLLQIFSVKYKKCYSKKSEELYASSRLSNIQKKADKITKLIVQHNKNSFLINQDYFVKPTISTMEIVCYLPDIIVDNEEDFKKLIDYLYKLFWETKARNYAQKKDLDFINNIRRYYYHDLEHGKNSDIKRKFNDVKEFYKSALGKNFPETAKDWQIVQEYIYDLLIEFLESIQINELIIA